MDDGLKVPTRLAKWQKKFENVGLKISKIVTVYSKQNLNNMFCDFGGLFNCMPIALDGVPLPGCSDFRYHSSLIKGNY